MCILAKGVVKLNKLKTIHFFLFKMRLPAKPQESKLKKN